jgi:phage FluMu protein Com
MSEQPCPGPCNSRYRKARAEYDKALAGYDPLAPEQSRPEPPAVQPWPGDPWCPKCKSIIHAELSQIDDAAAILAARPPLDVAGGDEETRAGRVSGTREARSPSPRMDDLEELGGWLRNWESAFRGTDPMPRRGYLATERTTIISWLVDHFDSCICHPDLAADYGAEIRRWYRELTAKARAGIADKHVKKPCPRCRLYTLWARDGEDYVRCVNEDCNRRMTREELAGLAGAA